ncbi:uncharacterized protein ARMOST_02012 [Armillaria ostoyae]|uniref:Uncharacterized protein n=1 Tax=Armillaria ostoyae TaxID=47428 RepID=A0A284QQM5_ARMOS|nr:uncharacterized protein ARMOST_02012 [Armillaria ostoyae]
MSGITITHNPDRTHTKTFIFHSVTSSRIGYVKDETTMEQVKAVAGDYVKGDIQGQDRQEFQEAKVFLSQNTTIPIEYSEPQDRAKAKTLGTDPSARGIIFVPAPNSIPQDQQLNPILAPAPAPASPPAADPDAVVNINRRLDAFLKDMSDMTKNNNMLKEEIAVLNGKAAISEKLSKEQEADNHKLREEITGLKEGIAGLKDQVADLEKVSKEREAAYEDIHGWLITHDTKYMDRLQLRHILDLGQARLARFANLPTIPAQSQLAGPLSRAWRAHLAGCIDNNDRLSTARVLLIACTDVETTSMSDGVLRLFTEYPSDIRIAGDQTAHPTKVSATTYSEVVARLPDDQRASIRASIAYSLKFLP